MTTLAFIVSEVSAAINYLYYFYRSTGGQRSVKERVELRSTGQSHRYVIVALGHWCSEVCRP